MFPVIYLKETGINLRRIMDKRGITAKDIQEYLNLASVQSVYNWCNGINMPTIDNLYALSQLFQLPIDAIVRGNRKDIVPEPIIMDARERRLWMYYRKIRELAVA
ncbi:MAG: helix-turn-helix transcriptional regulator [Lachnospiraceae bacterium]|nr:helix-turn-helix transcriptional regulator [Lachnospiraceae bacterium]